MLEGPNFESLADLENPVRFRLSAPVGNHYERYRAPRRPRDPWSIVGRALYEGHLDLKSVLAVSKR